MYYEQIFKTLTDAGVDYLVVGGVALVLHGVVRLTIDLDLRRYCLARQNTFVKGAR